MVVARRWGGGNGEVLLKVDKLLVVIWIEFWGRNVESNNYSEQSWVVCFRFTKRIAQKCSHSQNKKVEERERGRIKKEGREGKRRSGCDVLIILIAVTISQCRHMSKHQAVPLKYIHLLCAIHLPCFLKNIPSFPIKMGNKVSIGCRMGPSVI